MKQLQFFLGIIALLSAVLASRAQDVHYSQFYNTPLYINPAYTGNMDCNLRAGLNYRKQAESITVPFLTYSAFLDGRLEPDWLGKRSWIGLGGLFYYDNAGDGSLTTNRGMFFGSFSQGFNSDNSLFGSLGVGVGASNKSVDFKKFTFDNQWDPLNLQFDPSLPSGENVDNSSIFYPDFNLGLMLSYLTDDFAYELGASVSHITEPRESFYGEDNKLGRKYIVHGNIITRLNDRFQLKPEAFHAMHEGTSETVAGASLIYGSADLILYGGLWHRFGRDIIPMAGFEYNKFALMVSYDINISKQHLASGYDGGLEISLVKNFCRASKPSRKRECENLEFASLR